MGRHGVLYLASVAVHGAMAAGISALRQAPQHETVAISVIEEAPPPVVEPPPEAVPPKPEPVVPAASEPAPTKNTPPPAGPPPAAPSPAAAKPAQAEEPAASTDDVADVPDFGVTLSGGSGGGFALPPGDPRGRAGRAGGPRGSAPRPPAARPKANAEDACQEPLVKARPVTVPEPSYTEAARAGGVAGKVRVEMAIDATGRVTSAKILAGLGYGLDEAALASARRATFEPAVRCGRPVASTFVIAMRFSP